MPALRRLGLEHPEFEVSLGYIKRPCLRKKSKNLVHIKRVMGWS
jgi:hypothetical protein